MVRMRGHNQAGSNPVSQIKPCIVTNVQGIVKVTTACWSIDIGEGGLGVSCSIAKNIGNSSMMSTEITYTEAEANFKNLCDRAVATGEVIVITIPNGKKAVLISEAELETLLETLYLLSYPATATHLLTALKRAKSRVIQPQTLDEICQKFGINQEDDSENEVAIAS